MKNTHKTKNVINALLELDGMLVGLIWISILWSVSIPLMIIEEWTVYLFFSAFILLASLTHFYFMFRHMNKKSATDTSHLT